MKYKTIQFGTFRGKPIPWVVLFEDEEKQLLQSRDILLYSRFDKKLNLWESSELKRLLNGRFLTKNLNSERILTNYFGHKVFILSKREIEHFYPNTEDRIKTYNGGIKWYWTRSHSPTSPASVYGVNGDGSIDYYWYFAYIGYGGVVPAVWIKK